TSLAVDFSANKSLYWHVRACQFCAEGVSPWATGTFSIQGVEFPNLEQEPNDSAVTANPLQLGMPVYGRMMRGGGSAYSGDQDWYKLTVPSPGTLTIHVT